MDRGIFKINTANILVGELRKVCDNANVKNTVDIGLVKVELGRKLLKRVHKKYTEKNAAESVNVKVEHDDDTAVEAKRIKSKITQHEDESVTLEECVTKSECETEEITYEKTEIDDEISMQLEEGNTVEHLAKQQPETTNTVALIPISYICHICNDNFNTKMNLKKHFQMTHNDIKLITCTICEMKFENNTYFQIHLASHKHGNHFKCNICDAKFLSYPVLRDHSQKVHRSNAVERDSCEFCDRTFCSTNAKRKHVDVVHFNLKPYKCDQCDKCFSARHHLARHQGRMHSGVQNSNRDVKNE